MEKEWCSTQQLVVWINPHSPSVLRGMLSARRCQKLSASEVSMPQGSMRIQTLPEEEKKKEVLPQSIDIHTLKHVLEYAQVMETCLVSLGFKELLPSGVQARRQPQVPGGPLRGGSCLGLTAARKGERSVSSGPGPVYLLTSR